MKQLLALLTGLIFALVAQGQNLLQNSATVKQVRETLILDKSWIPYPAYEDRSGWNMLTGTLQEQLIKDGEKHLNYEWRTVKATDYLEFERSGSRVAMETPFGANGNALSTLVMAELAEGEGRFINQIINGVWVFSEMTSWALSAHLAGSQSSKRALPDVNEHLIDLTSGDMGSLLAWTHHFFKTPMDQVDPSISIRLRQMIKERILEPYMNRDDFWWQALDLKEGGMVNNWNPWCNFNVLTCFMLLEEDPELLAAAVHKTMTSVDQFFNYYHPDGACEEGPAYWGHAAGKAYDYLQLLSYATQNQISVFNEPKIRNMGEYIARSYIGKGWVVNFADASAKGGGDMSLIYRYGKAVKSTEMKQFAGYLYEQGNKQMRLRIGRDLFRAMESLSSFPELANTEVVLPQLSSTWYNGTEFCYMKNQEGLFFAAKGGFNNESHNHNDVGTFLLYAEEVPFFIDVGVGTYTKETFNRDRYSIFSMQSAYHNVPEINGQDQKHGAQYRSADAHFDESKMEFSLNLAKAYALESDKSIWKRSYRLDGNMLHITDEYALKESKYANELYFMTWAEPDVSTAGKVLLEKEGKKLILHYPAGQFDVTFESVPLADKRLSNVWGDQVYRVVLKDRKIRKKGTYQLRIQKL